MLYNLPKHKICLFGVNNASNAGNETTDKDETHTEDANLWCVNVRNVALYSVVGFVCISAFVVAACSVGLIIIRRNLRTERPHYVTRQVRFDAVCADTHSPDVASPDEACTETLETTRQ